MSLRRLWCIYQKARKLNVLGGWALQPSKFIKQHKALYMHCPDTTHDVHVALTWQQGWRLGVGTPPVQLEASPVLLLLRLPGSLHLKVLAWVCQ